jgi:hypothetical protein
MLIFYDDFLGKILTFGVSNVMRYYDSFIWG